MPDQLSDLIKKLSEGSKSILVLGETVDQVLINKDPIHLSEKNLDQLSEQNMFDFVLIKDLLETLSYEKSEHIIAQVRDIHAREILLILSDNSEWKTTNLIGLGLRQIAEIEQQNATLQVWYFAQDNYKRVPEWLNSQYWANPQNFDKYRW